MKTLALPMSFDVLAVQRNKMKADGSLWFSRFRWTNAPFFSFHDAALAFDAPLNIGHEMRKENEPEIWVFTTKRPPSRRVFLQAQSDGLVFDRVEDIADVEGVIDREFQTADSKPLFPVGHTH